MNDRKTSQPKMNGFSLMENLISLTVIALLVPTALAALTLSLDYKRKSSQESKVIQIAQYVFSEIPFCWLEEQSILFPNNAPIDFPNLPSGDTLSILFASHGKPYTSSGELKIGDTSWEVQKPEEPISTPQEAASGFIATVKKSPNDLGYDSSRTERFKVTVEYPAGAPSTSRESFTYFRLYSAP